MNPAVLVCENAVYSVVEKPGKLREFVNSGKFRQKLREFKTYPGTMMLSQKVTVLQYSMCCLSTFFKATLMLYDIRCISWTSTVIDSNSWVICLDDTVTGVDGASHYAP